MEVAAKLSNVRMSAQKARLVGDQIRGLPVEKALNLLKFSPKKAATIIKKVLDKVSNKRFICFVGSIEQCNDLGGTQAVHSDNTNKENSKLVDDFNNGITNSLFAVNKLLWSQ